MNDILRALGGIFLGRSRAPGPGGAEAYLGVKKEASVGLDVGGGVETFTALVANISVSETPRRIETGAANPQAFHGSRAGFGVMREGIS